MSAPAKAALLPFGTPSRQVLPSGKPRIKSERHSTRAKIIFVVARQSEKTTIVSTPDVLGGKPRIAGRRVAVQHIAVWHNRLGMSVDEIAKEYDLSPDDVRTALDYYQNNRETIDADIREEEALIAEVERQAKPLVRR